MKLQRTGGKAHLHLAVILDLHSRRVIGWAVSDCMRRDLAIRALKMAIALRSPPRGCIFHSDRGSQYCSHDYPRILREHGLQSSVSGKGNCDENAIVEAFFKTIKAELVWRRTWETRRQAETTIFQYINGFYNPRRRHSALRGKAPGLRTPGSLKEHLERHNYATVPRAGKSVIRFILSSPAKCKLIKSCVEFLDDCLLSQPLIGAFQWSTQDEPQLSNSRPDASCSASG